MHAPTISETKVLFKKTINSLLLVVLQWGTEFHSTFSMRDWICFMIHLKIYTKVCKNLNSKKKFSPKKLQKSKDLKFWIFVNLIKFWIFVKPN